MLCVLILLALGAMFHPSLAHAQSPEPLDAPASLSILSAAPGRITLSALRADGLPVRRIDASSLLVREGDGMLQPVTAVDAFVDEAQSLSIVLVLDNSSAMSRTLRTQLRSALPKISAVLQPHDLLRVVSSGATAQAAFVEYPTQPDAAASAEDAVAHLTRLLDAPPAAPGLNDALSRLTPAAGDNVRPGEPDALTRRLVIVISAGRRPTGIGRWNEYDAVAHTQSAPAPIFTFALASPGAADEAELEFLRHIAAQTHGAFGHSTEDIIRAIDSMRTNYAVRYAARMPSGREHDVEIVSLHDFGPRGRALADSSSWDRFDDARAVARIQAAPELLPTPPATTARALSPLHSIGAFLGDVLNDVLGDVLGRPRWAHIAVASLISAAIAFLVRWIVRELRR